jgi:hypothetical protein
MSSAVLGRYQKLRVVVPVGGMVTVWEILLSPPPLGPCAGVTVPSRAELFPVCDCVVVAVGVAVPPVVHEVRPFSKPPLSTCSALEEGVTALECGDSGPVPAGFDAVTVKVYVVPLVKPDTTADVGAGLPGTVVGVWAFDPMYGVMV